MEELPNELLYMIFDHLSLIDIYMLSQTCKYFNYLINGKFYKGYNISELKSIYNLFKTNVTEKLIIPINDEQIYFGSTSSGIPYIYGITVNYKKYFKIYNGDSFIEKQKYTNILNECNIFSFDNDHFFAYAGDNIIYRNLLTNEELLYKFHFQFKKYSFSNNNYQSSWILNDINQIWIFSVINKKIELENTFVFTNELNIHHVGLYKNYIFIRFYIEGTFVTKSVIYDRKTLNVVKELPYDMKTHNKMITTFHDNTDDIVLILPDKNFLTLNIKKNQIEKKHYHINNEYLYQYDNHSLIITHIFDQTIKKIINFKHKTFSFDNYFNGRYLLSIVSKKSGRFLLLYDYISS